jgi:hypothetical protein
MKQNTKDILKIVGCFAMLTLFVGGVGGCKYKLWRIEHPDAPTWIFFIPSGK